MGERRTTAEERIRELEAEGHNDPEVPELPEPRKFRTTGFSRMPMDWRGTPVNKDDDPEADALMISQIHQAVRRTIDSEFRDALEVLDSLYRRVRTQDTNDDGSPKVDQYGPVWEATETGMPREDWSVIGYKEREQYLYQTTTRLFDWRQRATEAWAEAMFAKAVWEEAFAVGYEELPSERKVTIEDRTSRARLRSREARYFAIFKTYYSKQAEELVKSFELLNQRMKDLHSGA